MVDHVPTLAVKVDPLLTDGSYDEHLGHQWRVEPRELAIPLDAGDRAGDACGGLEIPGCVVERLNLERKTGRLAKPFEVGLEAIPGGLSSGRRCRPAIVQHPRPGSVRLIPLILQCGPVRRILKEEAHQESR